jgi:CHAT domain-containing protein
MYAGLITAKRLDPAIQKLSKLVAQPLIDATPKARQWFICPDGALTGVPLRLLRHRGRYLVEMTAQHYLGSGRELLRLGEPSREKYTSAPLVLGAPDFNLRLKTPVNDGQKQDRFLPCQTLSALPSAANEARAVAAQWPKAKLLLGAHA